MVNKYHIGGFMLLMLAVFTVIWLPTGTPEDIFTTGALIATIGFWPYVIISCIFVALLLYFGIFWLMIRKDKQMARKIEDKAKKLTRKR